MWMVNSKYVYVWLFKEEIHIHMMLKEVKLVCLSQLTNSHDTWHYANK